MEKIDRELSVRLKNMMFVCTCLIMLMHLPNPEGELYKVIFPCTLLAVPAFFVISGFLLGQHCEEEGWYRRELRKRFWSLVVPYFVLNSFYIPFLYLYHNVLNKGDWFLGGLGLNWYSVSRIYGLTYKFHPAVGVLWYVRFLVFLVVISPVFVAVIRKSRVIGIVFLCALFMTISGLDVWIQRAGVVNFFYSFINLHGFFFFSLGIFFAYWRVTLSARQRFLGVLISLMGVVLVSLFPTIKPRLELITAVMKLSIVWLCLPAINLPIWLTAPCFVYYVLHQIVYQFLNYTLLKWFPCTGTVLLFVPMVVALGLIAAFCMVIRRFVPVIGRVFFGGRV